MVKKKELNGNIISDRTMRDKLSNQYNVLEKVKNLLLLPGTELMSINKIAEYYEVSPEWIKELYGSHREEIDSDGTDILSRDYYDGSKLKPISVERKQTSVTYLFSDGQNVTINNRGLKVFSKRAVLRIGMLLQQSEVAKRVRTALLDIEGKASDEIKIQDITEEQKLALELGLAIASGDVTAIGIATGNYMAFKNRHIEKLQNDNKALALGILEWEDRKRLNAGIRKLSSVTGIQFAMLWNELFKNLQYKYGIDLKNRQKKNEPYISNVKESEWNKVIKSFCAMCEAYGQSPTDMFQQITPLGNLK